MPRSSFPIVGIGASAGGVEALEGLFRHMPAESGIGFVVVTHIGPDHASLLAEVVARYTSMPVMFAEDGVEVAPDTVYVLPSSASITIGDGVLRIVPTDRGRHEHHPIDVFLASLARDCGDSAASIVLSGGDGDGTLGTRAVKERGGLTMAQVADGQGAFHSDMPRSAIATGLVDLAVPVEEMGRHLAVFARSLADADMAEVSADASDGAGRLDQTRHEIYAILRNQVGHDFAGYKVRTFDRRVGRRMQVAQLDTLDGYVELLRRKPREAGALFRDLLINVTNFFRDTEAFDKLAEIVVPRLLEGRGADDTVRVWVPGCATGEEVYSVAILIRERMERMSAVPRVQIFATDIDERALAIARAGRYPEGLLDNLTPERRGRYFIQDGSSFVLSKDVRDLCIFSPHSVIRDPPFSRIDLVSCRNLLIYFGTDVQNLVIPTFHYALKPGGFLFLGTSESVSQFADLFTPLDKKQRIFQARDDHAGSLRLPTLVGHAARVFPASPALPPRQQIGGVATMRQVVERQVLERFAPAHVVATRDGDVVYYSARTGKYLEPAAGAPTRQLVNMARKGLRLDLRTAFSEALERQNLVTRESVPVELEDGRIQLVTLSVEPLAEAQDDKPLFLVLFADEGSVLSRETALTRAQLQHGGAMAHLETELRETRERLQSLIEEYETALEELKSSNEELVSVNEELQSTNEELEASKEELQSLNEELHTVNAELNLKVEALDRANSDLRNLFESTPLATVFLDRNLVIRSFTPAVTEIFNILPGDRGRPLTDLASRVGVPNLSDDVASVFATGRALERTPDRSLPGPHLLVRLAPYRSAMERVEGVVVTFVDISTLIRAEQRQQVLIDELLHRTRNLLVVVRNIARQTIGRGGTIEGYSERLSALGRVQNLVSRAATDTVDLRDLVALELDAQGALDGALDGGRVEVAGPPVGLRVEQVQTLALAVHELTTNAAKYGALAAPEGRLSIRWHVVPAPDDARCLVLDWIETGVALPPVAEMRQGYGRELIERALPFDLGARTHFGFGPDGVRCRMEITLDRTA
ncbi:chemotaxis protein CheR [Lichenibacterium minor]|uniref:histidine kinase n=1 Tax=Lichenibacterium minor TaxID=2316528 RepID=A0A4Q2U9C4_9HYPH|nr:CheR family methyltransferase [Lichenibacterium minor]RYC33409.1 chemotaxis protein CheR [Lichenibacterium minor]